MMRFALTFLLFLAALPLNAAPDAPGTAEFAHGYFCALDPVATETASGTVSGTVNIVAGAPVFIGPGPQVPARLGIGFGVKVRARPGMAGPVTVQIQHPPMGPNAVTQQFWNTDLSDSEQRYLGYTFEEAYEVLPGRWTMSASRDGRMIYSVSFQLVDPRQMPWIDCGKQIPLS